MELSDIKANQEELVKRAHEHFQGIYDYETELQKQFLEEQNS